MLWNNTNVYILTLSTMPLKKGQPTAEGQMCRLELVADAVPHLYDPLPEGKYSYINLDEVEDPLAGSFIGADSDFLDVFVNPDDPESGELVAYQWTITGGSVEIEKIGEPEDDTISPTYSITCEMEGAMINPETGEITDSRSLSATYTGTVVYDNPNAYTPLGGDVEMDIPNLSGRYNSSGEWYLTFFNVPLDDQGYVIGGGDLLNVVILTEEQTPMDCEALVGSFSSCDTSTDYRPDSFAQGFWYNLLGNVYVVMGTGLTICNDSGEAEKVGLAVDGEIIGTKVSADIYRFDFDLITPEGDKMTGSWEGCVKDYCNISLI